RAALDLAARLEGEVRARETTSLHERPARRMRDWEAARDELRRSAAQLVSHATAVIVRGDACVTARVPLAEFEAAVERARTAGRGAVLRVAIVPFAVLEPSAENAWGLRELYGATLRTALESGGLARALSGDLVYEALERRRWEADRPLSRPAELARALGA